MAIGDPYATLLELKTRLDIDDTADDGRLTSALASASRIVNGVCHRQFNQTTTATARLFRTTRRRAQIDDFHTVTDLVVAVGSQSGGFNTTWTINTDFYVDPVNRTRNEETGVQPYWRIIPLGNKRFPVRYGEEYNLQVTAQWGWPSVPEDVKEATKLMATRLFRRVDSPEGVLGGFDEAVRLAKNDPDVMMLLGGYQKHVPEKMF